MNARDDWRAFDGSRARWLAQMLTVHVNESLLWRDLLPAADDLRGIVARKLTRLREARPRLRSAR
jgi:hypothetical protein